MVWDDGEERRYREWVRAEVGDRPEAEWAEYKAETDHRTQCRADTEARAGNQVRTDSNVIFESPQYCVSCQVEWEDGAERLLRARYTALRESGELVWDCSGERVEQERCRREQDQRRNQPVTWDDADERAYMESYRKKYNK